MLSLRYCTRSFSVGAAPSFATIFLFRPLFTDGKRVLGNDNKLTSENVLAEMEKKKSLGEEDSSLHEYSVVDSFASFWSMNKKDNPESMLPSLDQLMKEIPSSEEVQKAINNEEGTEELFLKDSNDDDDD